MTSTTSDKWSAISKTVFLAFCLIVATLITGVLGMNFKNAPGLDWRDGFLLVAGIMVVVSLPMFLYFRRKQWL